MEPLVIIGSGLAGYTVAKEYRKLKKNDVVVITQDDGAFYSKPMLSNALEKKKTAEQLATASAEKMSEDIDIRVIRNTIISEIDSADKTIVTSSGDKIGYSQLVLAVGALPIEIDVDSEVSKKVFHVNSLQDYTVFRKELDTCKRIAIIGPGLIGCEFANDLAQAGYDIDVIGPSEYPLEKLVPVAVGEFLKDSLSTIGVQWHLKATVENMRADEGGVLLSLTNGEKIKADIVLSAIGLKPNLNLALQAGLNVGRGILVDKFLHTSERDIFALGDCAELDGHVLPFILPLMTEARGLAKTLTGTATAVVYPTMPIVVKTSVSPIVVCPPAENLAGRWKVEPSDAGVKAVFFDKHDKLKGFCLIGDTISEKQNLLKKL